MMGISDQELPHFCSRCGATQAGDAPEGLCPRCTMGMLLQDKSSEEEANWMSIPGLTVHEEVGEGGFGIVYLATQAGRVTRRVALKVLKPGLDTRRVLRRFQVEQQALAHLEHPHIARIYDTGETEKGYPYFTMEFIDGVPITEYFKGGNHREILETFVKICDAVSFAHAKGVIHRDLKPSNILVSAGCVPKVIDFGIAKAVDPIAAPGMSVHTLEDTWIGTPEYMAPEQGRESELIVDERSDLFALGKILDELLSPDASPSLRKVITKATESKPENRYRTVKDFEADLRSCLAGKKLTRSKVPFWVGGIMATFAMIAAMVFWPDRPSEAPQDETKMTPVFHAVDRGGVMTPRYNRDGSRALVLFRDSGPALLMDPRDGRLVSELPVRGGGIRACALSAETDQFILGYYNGRLQWFDAEDGKPTSALLLASKTGVGMIDQIEEVGIPGHEKAVLLTMAGKENLVRAWSHDHQLLWEVPLKSAGWGRAVSPDRRRMVIGSGNGNLTLIDLVKGEKIAQFQKQKKWISGLKSLQGDRGFIASAGDGLVVLFDWDGHEQLLLDTGSRCNDFGLSPDNQSLATGDEDGVTRVWDLESGGLLAELACGGPVWQVVFSPDGRYLATTGKAQPVRVWDVTSGKQVIKPISPEKPAFRVSFAERDGGNLNLMIGMSNFGVSIHPLDLSSK